MVIGKFINSPDGGTLSKAGTNIIGGAVSMLIVGSPRTLNRFIAVLVSAVLTSASLFSAEVSAGNSWMSKANSVEPLDDLSFLTQILVAVPTASNDNAATVFDVLVSLHNDPSGDDNPKVVDNPTAEQQTKYENIIRYWADGVCEQSNGAHHLGKVRIFRNGKQQSKADVVWVPSCHPSASPAGFGVDQRHINMCDSFSGVDFLSSSGHQGGGYTLAHEWGHYVYGLFDEYKGSSNGVGKPVYWPRNSDVPTTPSIMNSQWKARPSNYKWLNHSTSSNIGDVTKTGQGRTYGKSGWDVLVQPTGNDPKNGEKTAQPSRTRYTAMDAVKPTVSDNWVKVELSGSNTCRDDLEIIWMKDELGVEIVIDKSGSMSSQNKMDNAKQAAKNLVEVSPDGATAVGIVAFSSSASVILPVTEIPDPGATVKAAIKAAIDPINASGGTNMYRGADLALMELLSYQANAQKDVAKVTYLLSDGVSSGGPATTTIANYNSNDTAIITFSYGTDADIGQLMELSNGTGGQFYQSPTSLSQIQAAFLAASASTGSTQTLIEGAKSLAPAGNTTSVDFIVDSTVSSATLLVNYSGGVNDLSLAVIDPRGSLQAVFDTADCNSVGAQTSCTRTMDVATIQAGGPGVWMLEASNTSGADVELELSVAVSAIPGGGYALSVSPLEGSSVSYPSPIVLQAMVGRNGGFVAGLDLTATVTAPSGLSSSVPINDDGTNGDQTANDGIYSAVFSYAENGSHTVRVYASNSFGTAQVTMDAFQISANTNGNEPTPTKPVPLRENFNRAALTQVRIQGLQVDDHPDTGPGTPMASDNSDVPGLIEFSGDVDFFQIQNVPTTKDLTVRVTGLSAGMDPELTIYRGSDGAALITGDLATASSPSGYVALSLPASALESTMWASVRHVSAAAAIGGYEISAGGVIASDDDPYTVIPSVGSGGRVSPSRPQTVTAGATKSFTVTANSGYTPSSTVGGTCPKGSWSGNTWTTDAISANCTVSFSFRTLKRFSDVPPSYWAWPHIVGIADAGITTGCGSSLYCPGSFVTRAEMAAFLLRGIHGGGYKPPVSPWTRFRDVPKSYWAVWWIEQLAAEGVTLGCGGGRYCPDNSVTRAEMAVFLLRSKYGSSYNPPAATGVRFKDVPKSYWAASWIEKLAADGVTTGCGGGNYCPDNSVTRAEMAVFLARTFNLPLPLRP